jgi:hypothetical protein
MVKIKVLDYYNKPAYYPYMPDDLFTTLEKAFIDDLEYISVPGDLFNEMLSNFNNNRLSKYNLNPN